MIAIVVVLVLALFAEVSAQDKTAARAQAGAKVIQLMTKCLSKSAIESGEKDKKVEVTIEKDVLIVSEIGKDLFQGYAIPLEEISRVYRPSPLTMLACRTG